MEASLLSGPDAGDESLPSARLSDNAVRDLELDRLAGNMSHAGVDQGTVLRFLTQLPRSREGVIYRQDIVRDLWQNNALVDVLASSIGRMQELTVFSRSAADGTRPLLEAAWRLSELDLYVDLVDSLWESLQAADIHSRAITNLRDELGRRRGGPDFSALREELPSLRKGLQSRRSVTIGVNLDERLRPVEAALVSVNEKPFLEAQFLKRFFGAAGGDPYVTRTELHRTVSGSLLDVPSGQRLPLSPLFQELEEVLKSVLRPLARRLRQYARIKTDIFRHLFPEIGFLLGTTGFLKRVEASGHRLTFPDILPASERRTELRGLYNLRLAAHRLEEGDAASIVTNDALLGHDADLFVLTGPNGGGKTTFTQAIGIATVFGQAGFPVPATRAWMSPSDSIVTHFPVEEDYDDDLGRFEDEVRRVSETFDCVGEHSLVLLNEPLTSTGPAEAVGVARDVLAGLRMAGVRGVFTTHFHQLAAEGAMLNESVPGRSCIGTLNAEVSASDAGGEAVRTYRISEGPPSGSSYASDIARRFRIDLDSLRRRIEHRAT